MKTLRIGTRNSPLALVQAQEVAKKIQLLGYAVEIIAQSARGDKNLTQPLYNMGITGVFTRDLDIALLDAQVDIAVHSLKDVPTSLPMGLAIGAVLERDFPQDVLVKKAESKAKALDTLTLATSSLRRRAFWAGRFPHARFGDIRGNVQTRLEKLEQGEVDATIFSLAGIKRLGLSIDYQHLEWMLPAPAQGIVCCTFRENEQEVAQILAKINHEETQLCAQIERRFLSVLEGGCTAPIGAKATFQGDILHFQGMLSSLDGALQIVVNEKVSYSKGTDYGFIFAEKIKQQGGDDLMKGILAQIACIKY